MAVDRMNRINSQLARELSLLMGEVKNAGAAGVVITSVDCSRDLKNAKVYFTSMDRHGRKAMAQALNNAAGFLRSRLGQLLTLRTVPQLTFHFDSSEEQARKMDELLDQLMADIPDRNEEDED